MLLTLTVGGLGLHLAGGANYPFIIDPHLEKQACDRIHRIGQQKEVHIYKFVCVETIEERIQKLQEEKLALAHNVLTGYKLAQSSKLSIDDLQMLFNMK